MSELKNNSFTLAASTKPAAFAGAIALLVSFGAGCGSPAAVMTNTEPATNNVMTTTPPATTNTNQGTVSITNSTHTYKDGTYVAKGDYTVHAGPEQIEITVTLKNDVVTNTSFKGTPRLPMSQRFMDMFDQNYKPMVVGKKLSELKLGKVSGSSLTPMGFNDAIKKIKQQAST